MIKIPLLTQSIRKKYAVEIILITAALILTLVSFILYSSHINNEKVEETMPITKNNDNDSTILYVDISGSVKKPGVYVMKHGERVNDIVKKAGGLSEKADKEYFTRTFNLAKTVQDEEKIYIPSKEELSDGSIEEKNINQVDNDTKNSISINDATIDELDTIPSIGKITAQKIIDNRPYASLEDLVTKKVVGKATFEKIQNTISL